MDEEIEIPLIGLERKSYTRLFLRKNPFPQLGIPGIETPFTVDREKVIKGFQNSIYELTENGRGSITVLAGEYGNGKTHMLKVFKVNIKNQLTGPQYGALPIYVRSPGEEFEDLFYEIIEDIGKSLLQDYSYRTIKDYIYSAL
jgi:hypothetical protein